MDQRAGGHEWPFDGSKSRACGLTQRTVNTNDAAALGSLLHLLLLMWLGIVQLMRKVSGLWGDRVDVSNE